jgi:hypothetical protein
MFKSPAKSVVDAIPEYFWTMSCLASKVAKMLKKRKNWVGVRLTR